MPGPLGDAGRGHARSQPERYGCVAQVVRASGEGRGDLGGVRAKVRASAQTSLMALEATGWSRSLLNTRPSGAMPKVSM